ncbi:ATP-binding protein [Maribacter confluentis]|uniref:histidine kinase n=1 Tax=Maribacter confluentis TaxID=1656093 RepID=A0ABT8RNS6_9FLAO|nr:PAS domain-containing sensor histidine kinase [Maribacter confluentis]MDO1512233.1 ATP-binding protein [Maribacter confluentis]
MTDTNKEFYFLEDGGEMGQLMRNRDWSKTPIGFPETWPQTLRTTISIMLNSPFPMFLFWGKKLKCFYNDAYRPSLGINGKHPSILGMSGKEAWPEIWDDIAPLLHSVTEKGESIWRENQLIPIFRNGQLEDVYWTFSYSPVKDESGNIAGVLTVCTDTTEAVNAANKLRESERRFREIADLSPVWIWITDAQVNVEYANKELLKYIGLGRSSDFTGQTWESMVHPDDIKLVYDGFGEAVRNEANFALEYRVKNASTDQFEWFKVLAVPRYEDKQLKGFIGTAMNIEQQKCFANNLKSEVEVRTRELEDSNIQLEKMNKELQSFAYISSHDLQEPLRKIQMFAEVLLDKEMDNLSKKGKDKFEKIQSAANRMQSLINDLLAYSRADTEKRIFKKIELQHIIDEVKNDLAEEFKKKNGQVTVEESCSLEVVPFQFRQLMYNLVSNSLKYSKQDVAPIITIKGEIVNELIISGLVLKQNTKYAKITITDNGIGFENQFSDKIFEVFQRLHGKQDYVGTGVGLAIVKKIVQNHNGYISATGEPNVGSVFQIFIPEIHKG